MNTSLVKTYFACTLITIGALTLLNSTGVSLPIHTSSTYSSNREIVVTGKGEAQVKPDTAQISLGIAISRATTADKAQAEMDAIHNKLITTAKQLGISETDIQTSAYSIQPNYTYNGSTQRIDGYNGNAEVTIKTKKISALTQLLEQATPLGVNQISDISYSTKDSSAAYGVARERAIQDARKSAEELARLLDITLGDVVTVGENSDALDYPPPMEKTMELAEDGSSAPQIQTGSGTKTVYVTLTFERK